MGKQVTLTIPDELYQQARRIAQSRQRDVADILAESIVLVERDASAAPIEEAIDWEQAAFRRLHAQLWPDYAGQFVAVYNGKLVDHDPDQVALYLRVKGQHPGEFVWIAPVRAAAEEEYIIRSPRLIGEG